MSVSYRETTFFRKHATAQSSVFWVEWIVWDGCGDVVHATLTTPFQPVVMAGLGSRQGLPINIIFRPTPSLDKKNVCH